MSQPFLRTLLMQRRAFLRATSAAVAAIGAPSFGLSGCDASLPKSDLVVDPDSPWWLQHNFGPVFDELDETDLQVRGSIPPELSGVYVRNGSNPQASDNTHWFLGDGMVHGVRLSGGEAKWYRNRYVRTTFYEDGIRFGIPEGPNTYANVSLVYHADRLLASGEVGFPYELDPSDLSTVGPHDFAEQLTTYFTAHPAIDPATGFMHFFGYAFGPPFLTYCVADDRGALISCEPVATTGPTMMHSFAITDQDVIFWELPVVFDLGVLSETGWMFRWDEDFGARVGVMPLGGPATAIRWVEIEPCYVFHHLNAFRVGDDIVVDVCRYDQMMNGERFGANDPQLRRWTIGTADEQLTFSQSTLSERNLEFPYSDRRRFGRATRYGWFTSFRDHPETIDPAGVVRYDSQTGSTDEWDPGVSRQSGEAVFVPAGEGEGDGWLLTFVYDRGADATDLVILDATAVGAGPVAEVRMPRRVPHGFHGTWVPDPT